MPFSFLLRSSFPSFYDFHYPLAFRIDIFEGEKKNSHSLVPYRRGRTTFTLSLSRKVGELMIDNRQRAILQRIRNEDLKKKY